MVVMMAAKKINPPKAPSAIIAPKFNLAPYVSLRSPSIDSGTFTFGVSPCCIFALPDISLSWGCPATIICGTCAVVVWASVVVATFLGVVTVVLAAPVVVAEEVVSLMISVSAIMVVGTRVGLVRMRAVVAAAFVGFVTSVGAVMGLGNSGSYWKVLMTSTYNI